MLLKRLFDIALALVILGPTVIICLPCVIAIRLESRGPGLFRQVRVGMNQHPFKMYKLRTMSANTGDRSSHDVPSTQITRVGSFLRRSKLDELPQVLNVLAGHMSFVGPRPCLPVQTELVAERNRRGVFAIRPGITGTAQIAGIDMSTPVELAEIDAHYIQTRSFAGDLALIWATARGSGRGDAVI